jgi:hypothetical protein
MKNVLKAFGNLNRARSAMVPLLIIALVAVIGFSFAACGGDDDGGNNGGGNAVIGAKLELSGQVYTMTYNYNYTNYTVTYLEYKGNLTLRDDNGGNATITGGKLSYTIETPKPNNLETLDDLHMFYGYDNVTASDSSAKGFTLYNFNNYGDGQRYSLWKENVVTNIGKTSGTVTSERVYYVYVDKDVTITGKGKTETHTTDDGDTLTSKTNDFSLALKEGWNAVYTKTVSSATYPAGNPSAATSSTNTITISLKNPALKWVLGEERDN